MRTLLVNGRIHSPAAPAATSMLVGDGVIAWVGRAEGEALPAADEILDLAGSLVVPAFVDAHCHVTDTGLALTACDLSGAHDLRAALDLVESHARRSGGRPVLGSGWDETDWPQGRPPSRAELDRASYGGVVYLSRVDGHSAIVSSALLAADPSIAGLDGYRASGLLSGAAHHGARALALQSLTAGDRRSLQRRALQHAASLGIAAVHEMAGPQTSGEDDLSSLLALSRSETVCEVYGYWGELGGVARARELGATGVGGDLFCDGSLGSHTAALAEPYQDGDGSGALLHGTDDLVEHLVACTEAGMHAGLHAIGDAAVAQVVTAMRLASARFEPGRVAAAGHRIEHAELIPSIVELADCGLIASVQPCFDATWGGPNRMYSQRLGAERARRLNPLAGLAAAGVPLAFGSDSPVTPLGPWATVRAAMSPSNPDHAIGMSEALAAHTLGGWRAARADADGSGLLNVGSPATYAIFDTPSDDEPLGSLPRCRRTVLRGRQLFDSGDLG